jgi:hypothetical protein
LDDGWHDHPKVIAAGLDAAGLWTMCLTWAHANRRSAPTPGYVPRTVLARFAGSKASRLSKKLADVGLLDHAEGGWIVHDFADYLPKYDPAKAADAGKAGAEKRWGRGRPRAGEGLPADSEPPPDPYDEPPYEPLHEPPSKPDGGSLANRSRTDSKPMATRADTAASARRNPDPVPDPVVPSGDSQPPVPEVDARDPNEAGEHLAGQDADDLAALVAAVQAIRPRWTDHAVADAARRARTQRGATIADTRAALVAVAERADSTSPGRVLHDGPWWPGPPTPTPPPLGDTIRRMPEADPAVNERGRAAARAALAKAKPRPEETP